MTSLLKYLIAMVCVLLAVVVFVGLTSGGIDRQTAAKAKAEIDNVGSAQRDVRQAKSQVEGLVKADPKLFEPREISATQFDAIIKRLEETKDPITRLRDLLKENKTESEADVQKLTSELAAVRIAALAQSSGIHDTAQQLADFKKKVDENVPKMEADIKTIRAFDTAVLESKVAKAVADWPEKKTTLETRVTAYNNLKDKAVRSWESTSEARGRFQQNQLDGNDVDLLMGVAQVLSQTKAALQGASNRMDGLIDQLYWSWDKILADLEINEGSTVTFRQKFETTKVRALVGEPVPDGKTAEKPAEKSAPQVEWKTVDKQTYDKMSKSLGMVVEHKPAGKFDNESTKTTQPPGYSYIAPVNQQSNRYGRWERRNDGTSFWRFYGQYAFMRDMMGFGGSYYRPVSPSMYNDYRTYRDTGRSYYGQTKYGKPLYGSTGAVTKKNYSSSKYVATNGYKNSNYVKSGGTYKGSAYQTKRSSTYSSRSSSARSSSRSYSSRSSGFRSSGGFGGK